MFDNRKYDNQAIRSVHLLPLEVTRADSRGCKCRLPKRQEEKRRIAIRERPFH